MTKTLKLTTEQLEITASNQEQSLNEITKLYDFTELMKKELIFGNSVSYTSIDFGQVSNPTVLVLTSTEKLDVLINSQEFQNTDFIEINADIDNLSVKNISLSDATINISLYGEA